MPIYDDDNPGDTSRDFRDDEQSWDVDEDPGSREITPDDFTTVRCSRCKKLIFEDAEQCPYCKHWQMEAHLTGRPLWFKITVFFCIAVMVPGALALLLLWLWGR